MAQRFTLGITDMHVMLAESIDGGILVLLILFGVIVTTLLALGALIPASRGKRTLALSLSAPAFVIGVLVTAWLGIGYFVDRRHNVDLEIGSDLIMPWILMAGPALATSLLAVLILGFKKTIKPDA